MNRWNENLDMILKIPRNCWSRRFKLKSSSSFAWWRDSNRPGSVVWRFVESLELARAMEQREKNKQTHQKKKQKKQKNHDGWNFIAVVVVSLSSIAQLFFVFLFFSTRFQMKFCNFLDLFCFVFKLFFIYFIFGCVDDVKRKTVRHQTIRHLSVQRSSNNNPKQTQIVFVWLCVKMVQRPTTSKSAPGGKQHNSRRLYTTEIFAQTIS